MFSSDDSKGREVDIDRLGNSIFCFSFDCRADTSMKILHVEVIVGLPEHFRLCRPCRSSSCTCWLPLGLLFAPAKLHAPRFACRCPDLLACPRTSWQLDLLRGIHIPLATGRARICLQRSTRRRLQINRDVSFTNLSCF